MGGLFCGIFIFMDQNNAKIITNENQKNLIDPANISLSNWYSKIVIQKDRNILYIYILRANCEYCFIIWVKIF